MTKVVVAIAAVTVIFALASVAQDGQASGWMQTVPTVAPTATRLPATPTRTNTAIPPTQAQPQATTAAASTATAQSEPATATQPPDEPADTPTAASSATETPPPAPTSEPTLQPTQDGTNPASSIYARMLFFLVCGLGAVAGIVLIVLYAIRKAGPSPAPPPAGGPGQ